MSGSSRSVMVPSRDRSALDTANDAVASLSGTVHEVQQACPRTVRPQPSRRCRRRTGHDVAETLPAIALDRPMGQLGSSIIRELSTTSTRSQSGALK